MEYIANYTNFFHTAGYQASAAMAWGEILSTHGEGPRLTSAKHDVVEGDGRRFRTKTGGGSGRGLQGMARGDYQRDHPDAASPFPDTNPLLAKGEDRGSLFLLHRRLASLFELGIHRVSPSLVSSWLDIEKIEQPFECCQQPFRFARLHIDDLARLGTLLGVGCKVSNVSDAIDIFGQLWRENLCVKNLLDFVSKVPPLDSCLLPQQVLQAATAQRGTCLWAVVQHKASFQIVLLNGIRDVGRERFSSRYSRPHDSFSAQARRLSFSYRELIENHH